jgi:GntR family transcriptional repressor for pyruvate dehydrogenase complex
MARGAGSRPRLSDVLYADIMREINSGKWGAGARLPSEAEICTQFGVSRPIVRTALSRLRDEGVVQSRKGSGSFVVPTINGHKPPTTSIDRRIASIADVQKLYQFRVALEGEIAFVAARLRTEAQLAAIEHAADELGNINARVSDGTEEDIRFHRAIATATDNVFFIETFERLTNDLRFIVQLARNLLMSQPAKNIERVQADHAAIVDAIRAGNPELARERMQYHIKSAQARLFFGEGTSGAAFWEQNPPL